MSGTRLPERDHGVRTLVRVLDDLVPIPGTRFRIGLDPLLGLLPVGGDLAGAILSAYPLILAARRGAPASVLLRMGANVGIDTVLGAVPLLGDLFDAGWKANRRNLALLERYLETPETVRRGSRTLVVALLLALLVLVVGVGVLGFWLLRALVRAL